MGPIVCTSSPIYLAASRLVIDYQAHSGFKYELQKCGGCRDGVNPRIPLSKHRLLVLNGAVPIMWCLGKSLQHQLASWYGSIFLAVYAKALLLPPNLERLAPHLRLWQHASCHMILTLSDRTLSETRYIRHTHAQVHVSMSQNIYITVFSSAEQSKACRLAERITKVVRRGVQTRESSAEEKWRSVIDNPELWWNNTANKRNPKAPDFKLKNDPTGSVVLWITNRDTPEWAKQKLESAGITPVYQPSGFSDMN